MLDKDQQLEILRSIALRGSATDEQIQINPQVKQIPRGELDILLDRASGWLRIKPYRAKQFVLTLSQPIALSELNPFEIRCCLCHSVISYPAWHYVVNYKINSFHYFVCFQPANKEQPTAACIRR